MLVTFTVIDAVIVTGRIVSNLVSGTVLALVTVVLLFVVFFATVLSCMAVRFMAVL